MSRPLSLFDKLWQSHVVTDQSDELPAVLYVDLHLIHEVTSPQGFATLRSRGLRVRRPDLTLATMDHSTPTLPAVSLDDIEPGAARQLDQLQENCREFGITLHDWQSADRGIVHVIGPELGATQPGKLIVCGDSHTSTHGALGALAFGIGTTEVGHVLATQCLLQRKPGSMRIMVNGRLAAGVEAKDLALHIIGRIGVGGGTGYAIEYAGEAIEALSIEERMTLCNMSIEAGARSGMVAVDEKTIDYLRHRPLVPCGEAFDQMAEQWRQLKSDPGAVFDCEITIDASTIVPVITWGTHPGMVISINQAIPDQPDADEAQALEYMGLDSGQPMIGQHIDYVFIGSCTNSRISDLRRAAAILGGRQVADHVTVLVVPGSEAVRRQAEQEGLDRIFINAGAQWRRPGCSMCLAMNGDRVPAGKYAISTSNRNFAGRQGTGARTLLASPGMAAASAVNGCVTDPRDLQPDDTSQKTTETQRISA